MSYNEPNVRFDLNNDKVKAITSTLKRATEISEAVPHHSIYLWNKAVCDICVCRYLEKDVFKEPMYTLTRKNGFYERLIELCQKENIDLDILLLNIGLPDIILGYWKDGGEVSSDILIRLSEQLDVSIDFLLKGKV